MLTFFEGPSPAVCVKHVQVFLCMCVHQMGKGGGTPAPAANPSVPILVHPSAREKNHKKKVANWPLPLDRLRQVLRAVPRGADMDLRLMEEVGCISGHEAQAKPPVPPRTFRVRRAGFPRLGLGDIGGVPTPTPTPSFAAGRCGPPPSYPHIQPWPAVRACRRPEGGGPAG